MAATFVGKYPAQAYSTDRVVMAVGSGFGQVQHLQVGESEQVPAPAGHVHSVATFGPRVCPSFYSTDAFAKGKKDKTPAGHVHSVATLGPRVCLSSYSTDAFAKGKKDKVEMQEKGV